MYTECVGVSGKILKHSRMHPLLCDELAKFVTYIGEIMVLLHNRRKIPVRKPYTLAIKY